MGASQSEEPDASAPSQPDCAVMLRLLLARLGDCAVFLLDATGQVASWDAAAEQLTGRSSADALGAHYSTLFAGTSQAREAADEQLQRATRAGRDQTEEWVSRKDGTRFLADVEVNALCETNGGVRNHCVILRDRTSRGRSEVLLRSVLDHTLDGIISIDSTGAVQSFNSAAERLFGYGEGEVLGLNVKVLMPEPFHSQHDGYVTNYLRTGVAKVIGIGREVEGRRKDGSTFPMDLAICEFQLDDRRFFTGIVRDITDRKEMEEQLRQSQKMEAIGQLAGGVAHDFNNLLTIITGYTDLVLKRIPDTNPVHPFLREVLAAGERATSLTRQLLAFSRQSVIESRLVDVNVTVREIEKMLRRMIGEDVELATVLSPVASTIKVDPGQLIQVVMNLAVNARDAMPQGGKLTIETREAVLDDATARFYADAKPGTYVVISVTDTGVGMTAEVRSRIFEPFFTTKGLGKGTGLGLAVVHGIVRQSGGFIEVYSEPGFGSVFKVFLPAVSSGQSPIGAVQEAPVGTGTETILLVEDEPAVRDIALLILKEHGYTVHAAAGGNEAIEVADGLQGKFDLLVTDVVMPEMSGRVLAENLKLKKPNLKVLFLSGYTDDAVVRHGILQHEVSFLQKPFTSDSLARKVREVLDAK